LALESLLAVAVAVSISVSSASFDGLRPTFPFGLLSPSLDGQIFRRLPVRETIMVGYNAVASHCMGQ